MHVYIPCFDQDVGAVVHCAKQRQSPCYLRLGKGELPEGETSPAYAPWRQLLAGQRAIIIATGPIAGMIWRTCRNLSDDARPAVWVVSELPLTETTIPNSVLSQIGTGCPLIVVEEHILHGGLAQMVLTYCAGLGIPVTKFHSLCAAGIASGAYGSQTYLREQSGLTPTALLHCLGIYE
jgi:transketolase